MHLAYQVIGDGPIDLVLFGTFVSNVELNWENPSITRFLRGLASFSRLIVFDKRGVGMSDPAASHRPPTLEERMEDVRAVMDAAGSEQAALFGTSEGGQLAVLFAATYPERTPAAVLFSALACARRTPDYPAGYPESVIEEILEIVEGDWGGDGVLDVVMPSVGDDPRARAWWRSYFRRSVSPGAAAAQLRLNIEGDVRHVLGAVQVPMLVLHARDDAFVRADHGRYLAEHIPGARYVELDGGDHLPYIGAADAIVAETREFLTGVREPAEPDRVLATVLFSDIVGSTEQASALGDRRWRDTLDAHDTAVRRQLERFRGREVKATGDGFLATFDGPARAIRCGSAIREATRAVGVDVRVGLHTGE
ncbi:MAG: adenylate/guanylate cyclase domain-containing protein, partial [Actinobacteria bacterium]|nr:adenylate/guanylate cyclase domain-containing protein [Actinomycetota bacterium]